MICVRPTFPSGQTVYHRLWCQTATILLNFKIAITAAVAAAATVTVHSHCNCCCCCCYLCFYCFHYLCCYYCDCKCCCFVYIYIYIFCFCSCYFNRCFCCCCYYCYCFCYYCCSCCHCRYMIASQWAANSEKLPPNNCSLSVTDVPRHECFAVLSVSGVDMWIIERWQELPQPLLLLCHPGWLPAAGQSGLLLLLLRPEPLKL